MARSRHSDLTQGHQRALDRSPLPPPRPNRSPPYRSRNPLRARHHIVAPSLRIADVAAAAVLRRCPPARTDRPRHHRHRSPSLSIATVNRQVTALLEAGLLRERADLAVSGAIGRPRVPVEVNHEPFLTLGVHIGARTTSIVATDLLGRTLDAVETPTPRRPSGAALAVAGRQRAPLPEPLAPAPPAVGRRRGRWSGRQSHRPRRPPPAGLGAGPRRGGARRGAGPAGVGGRPRRRDGRRRTAARRARSPPTASSLYVYARETVGYALVIGGRVHTPASGPGTIANLPAQSELLGGAGGLESTVSDEAVLAAARRLGVIAGGAATAGLTPLVRGGPAGQRAGPRAARRAGPGARRSGGVAARPAQPRRSRGRRSGVHRVPRGHGDRRGRVRASVRCWRRATSGSPHSATGCRRPAPGSSRWAACTPTRSGRCGAQAVDPDARAGGYR